MNEYVQMIPLPEDHDDEMIEAALAMADGKVREVDALLVRESFTVAKAATMNGEPLTMTLEDGTEYTPPPVLRVVYAK